MHSRLISNGTSSLPQRLHNVWKWCTTACGIQMFLNISNKRNSSSNNLLCRRPTNGISLTRSGAWTGTTLIWRTRWSDSEETLQVKDAHHLWDPVIKKCSNVEDRCLRHSCVAYHLSTNLCSCIVCIVFPTKMRAVVWHTTSRTGRMDSMVAGFCELTEHWWHLLCWSGTKHFILSGRHV